MECAATYSPPLGVSTDRGKKITETTGMSTSMLIVDLTESHM